MATDHDVSGIHPAHPVILSKKELMASIPQLDRLVALAESLGALVDAVDGAGDAFTTRVHYPRMFGEFFERHAFVAFDVGGIRIYSNIQGEEDGLEERRHRARPLDLPQRTTRTAKGDSVPGSACGPSLTRWPSFASFFVLCGHHHVLGRIERNAPLNAMIEALSHSQSPSRPVIEQQRSVG